MLELMSDEPTSSKSDSLWGEHLVGKKLLFLAANYHYYGKVKTITDEFVELTEAIKYYNHNPDEKGATSSKKFISGQVILAKSFIESFSEHPNE